jgi:predicted Co/Zn/Cd cation transporter (cation efflux family)
VFSTTKYLGVTVTYGGTDQYIVQLYNMNNPDQELDVRVVTIDEAIDIVSAVVRTHDPRLVHSQDELEQLIGAQLADLGSDPTMRAAMWLPPEVVPNDSAS